VGTASLRSALTDIFEAAEKPLPTEMIGKRISDNNTADWDNIHTSYVNLFVYFGGIPSTSDCRLVSMGFGDFDVRCDTPPPDFSDLQYVVENLPSHIVQ